MRKIEAGVARSVVDRTSRNATAVVAAVIGRSSEPFDDLLKGKTGAGMFYDSFRRTRSLFSRKKFRHQHGEQFE